MKIERFERLIDNGGFSQSSDWKMIEKHIIQAIHKIEWPVGSG